MTTNRWATMLAELEARREVVVSELGLIDVAIGALQPLTSAAATAANGRRPVRRPAARRTTTKTRRGGKRMTKTVAPRLRAQTGRRKRDHRIDPELVAKAEQMYRAGTKITAIAQALRLPASKVYGWKYRYGWPKPGAPAAAKPTALPVHAGEGYSETPRRRCSNDNCGKITTTDPCGHCGEKWKNHK